MYDNTFRGNTTCDSWPKIFTYISIKCPFHLSFGNYHFGNNWPRALFRSLPSPSICQKLLRDSVADPGLSRHEGATYYYRPQTKFEKVMFSQVSVCPQGGVCPIACWDAHPQDKTPPDQTPPRADPPPGSRQTPPEQALPKCRHPPPEHTPPPRVDTTPRSACWEIRETSGRYASYWNAYLFGKTFAENCMKMK